MDPSTARENNGAVEIEGDIHLGDPMLGHDAAQPGAVLGLEKDEPSPRQPASLPPISSALAAPASSYKSSMWLLRHAAGTLALAFPMLVHQLAKPEDVARFEHLARISMPSSLTK